jgi:hypothetical protein
MQWSARPHADVRDSLPGQRAPEIVHADEMRHERGSIVFRRVQLVILTPCWIVHRRVATSEVAQVRQLHNLAEAMVSPGGYRVQRILVHRSLRRPPRPHLRVTWRGRWIADCRTAAEVARHVDLATLSDETAPAKRRRASALTAGSLWRAPRRAATAFPGYPACLRVARSPLRRVHSPV